MPTQDTIKLLNECNAGIKMAVESLDEVLDKAKNENLITILRNSLEEHKKLGDLTHQKLNEFHDKVLYHYKQQFTIVFHKKLIKKTLTMNLIYCKNSCKILKIVLKYM